MKEIIKTITSIIIITVLISIPLFILSKSIHEIGHVKEAGEYNVRLVYSIDNMISLEHGRVVPASIEDCKRFNYLSIENRKKILHAGVSYELIIFLPVMILSSFLAYLRYKKKGYNDFLFIVLAGISLSVFSILLNSVYSNILSSNPENDWHKLFMRC